MKRPDETLRKLRIHGRRRDATEDVKLLWAWIEQLETERDALKTECFNRAGEILRLEGVIDANNVDSARGVIELGEQIKALKTENAALRDERDRLAGWCDVLRDYLPGTSLADVRKDIEHGD